MCLGGRAENGIKKRNNWGEAGASLEMPVDSYRLVYLIEHLRARIPMMDDQQSAIHNQASSIVHRWANAEWKPREWHKWTPGR